MNSVILIGRLARDPEMSYTQQQKAVCKFTLAVDRMKKEDGADFIRVTVWDRQAETCDRYLRKGRQCAVMGRIQIGSYKNRNGETVYTTDVIAERVEFLGGGQETRTETQAYTKPKMDANDRLIADVTQMFINETGFSSATDDMPF